MNYHHVNIWQVICDIEMLWDINVLEGGHHPSDQKIVIEELVCTYPFLPVYHMVYSLLSWVPILLYN